MKILKSILFGFFIFATAFGVHADKLQVVATIFPLYDFARQIGGDKVDVLMLVPPGVEPHAYSPKPSDIVSISKSDVFIYIGEAMEPWAKELVYSLKKESLCVVDVSEGLELLDSHCGEDGKDGDTHGHSHDAHQKDPHVWLDPVFVSSIADRIAAAFSKKDPANSEKYKVNLRFFKDGLSELDKDIREALARCRRKTIFYGGHFAFSYFARRYGLKVNSTLKAFSPNAEPSPKAIVEIIREMKENNTKAVFFEEIVNPRAASIIAEETGAKMLSLNGAHSISKTDMGKNITYINIMKKNLENLKDGLEYQ